MCLELLKKFKQFIVKKIKFTHCVIFNILFADLANNKKLKI